jgi:hypothetical protein
LRREHNYYICFYRFVAVALIMKEHLMKNAVTALLAISMAASPALAQVRPADCRPVLPVVDQVAQVEPVQDVLAERSGPIATAAKRRLIGLPLWLAGLALIPAGAGIIDNGGGGRSPQ